MPVPAPDPVQVPAPVLLPAPVPSPAPFPVLAPVPVPVASGNSVTGSPAPKRRILMALDQNKQPTDGDVEMKVKKEKQDSADPSLAADIPQIVVTEAAKFDLDVKVKEEPEDIEDEIEFKASVADLPLDVVIKQEPEDIDLEPFVPFEEIENRPDMLSEGDDLGAEVEEGQHFAFPLFAAENLFPDCEVKEESEDNEDDVADLPLEVVIKEEPEDNEDDVADLPLEVVIKQEQEDIDLEPFVPFVPFLPFVELENPQQNSEGEEEPTSSTLTASEDKASSEEVEEDEEDDTPDEDVDDIRIISDHDQSHNYNTRYKTKNTFYHPSFINAQGQRQLVPPAPTCSVIARIFDTDKLRQFLPIFTREEIDISVLLTMDNTDFELLGLKASDIRLIRSALCRITY